MKFYFITLFLSTIHLSIFSQKPIISAIGTMNARIVQMDPIQFQSNMTCLDLKTGLHNFYAKKVIGEWNLNCKIDLFSDGLGLQFYPIPTTNEGTLKARKLLPSHQQFVVQIISMEGKILVQSQYTGALLFDGIHISTDFLQVGTYVLRVQSEGWQELCKFIKN